ncbi:DUF1003 domain-containing protein [Streptomyces fuscichromogenes]|uniref:DUF1003 domain-containing protein n=1 Tax=Streptomyces fuscichromogenes TaxID=1324013 RepID=A0A917XGJ2_9ACTN|nr:DUF1003 domain-containing protein [Streptomyces fuscichromogenes]GGN23600.1 hypothetical protein GCM10011578_056050 [Streptomyces fuscichromogenes]
MSTSPKRSAPRIANEQVVLAQLRGTQDRIADAVTAFSGTMTFVYLHAVWFAVWIVCNEGVFGRGAIWDPFPFGLLTMIVSLEAIFLSTFVMVSQNRQAARENVRADLDFETNVRSEVWSIHMGRALGIDPVEVEQRVQELLAENRARMNGTPQPPKGT